MKLIRFFYPIAIILFAWSVCVTMYNLILEETTTLFGYAIEYYMLPLFMINCTVIVLSINQLGRTRGLNTLVMFWLFFVISLYLLSFHFKFRELIEISLWGTSYLASYCIVKQKPDYFLKYKCFFLIAFVLGLYYFVTGKVLQIGLNSIGLQQSSNAVFCLLTVFPFLLLFRSKPILYSLLLVTVIAVIFSNKRSALLILAFALLPTLWASLSKIRSKTKRSFLIIALALALGAVFYYVSTVYLEGRIFSRFENISEDQGSGRMEIWTYVLNNLFNSTPVEWLMGHGHQAVNELGDASASHNDFLEVVYDYGLIVFVVYILIHIHIIKRTIYLYKTKNSLFGSYFFAFVVFFVMSWISILVVQPRYLIYLGIYWGGVEALIDRRIDYKLLN